MCIQICLSQTPIIQNSVVTELAIAREEHRAYCPWNPYYRTSAMIPLIAMYLLHQVKEHPHMSNFGELN